MNRLTHVLTDDYSVPVRFPEQIIKNPLNMLANSSLQSLIAVSTIERPNVYYALYIKLLTRYLVHSTATY